MLINEKDDYIEAFFFYRQRHTKLAFLLSFFLLILGLPVIIYGSPVFLIFLSPLFLGLLWVIWGSKRLVISKNRIEMSEFVGRFIYQKKVLLTKELESIHLHYEVVHDCCEGTDEVVFAGLVFTAKDDRQLKPFHYLNEIESQRLQEKIKDFLNLRTAFNCSCAKLRNGVDSE